MQENSELIKPLMQENSEMINLSILSILSILSCSVRLSCLSLCETNSADPTGRMFPLFPEIKTHKEKSLDAVINVTELQQ